MLLPDVQGAPDDRGVWIEEAGITDLRYPVTVYDGEAPPQHTIASVTMAVAVPPATKGAHMSRFVEVLDKHAARVGPGSMAAVNADVCASLGSERGLVEFRFPYFIHRPGPVSERHALLECECWLRHDGSLTIGVRVPVTTVCPCSKAISDYGAHNQRGFVSIEVRPIAHPDTPVLLADLIEFGESAGSAPVHPLLKRSDERHVTMLAYDNPVFVEDMVRAIAVLLNSDDRIESYEVHARNLESIHTHDAYASVVKRAEADRSHRRAP